MGQELEWKLKVPDGDTLDRILEAEQIRQLALELPRRYEMASTYYDTPDRRLGRGRITLRRRMENQRAVYCIKAPLDYGPAQLHSEWETEAEDLTDAVQQLVAQGAPAAALEWLPQLEAVCAAVFVRRAVLLGFSDGSRAELALDLGELRGKTEKLALCELELEQKRGEPAMTLALLDSLQTQFALQHQEQSKYARAKELR